jgi:hypothetical protein
MTENEKCGKGCPEGYIHKGGTCVLPEVTFTTLIMSLNSSALFHLGDIQNPETGKTGRDLVLAKHTIDTLQLLKDKTRGNLNAKEDDLLGHVLADLKLRYVKASG